MQQEQRWRVCGTGLPVKDGEPIYLCRAIKSWVLHGTFLSLGLGQRLSPTEHSGFNTLLDESPQHNL
jgi:hypothetical protein